MTSEALKELIRSTGYTTPSQLTVDNAGRNYICKFVADDEPYIIKIYSGETKQQIKKVYEKLSELKNTRKSCKFPNVIKSGIYHEDFYVIEEYIEGISLADYLNQENSISISEIISVIK